MPLKTKGFCQAIKAALIADSALDTLVDANGVNIYYGVDGSVPPDYWFPGWSISPVNTIPERVGSSEDTEFHPRVDIYLYIYTQTPEGALLGESGKLGLFDAEKALWNLFEFNDLSLADDFDTTIIDSRYEQFIVGDADRPKLVTALKVSLEGYYHN